MTKYKRKYRGLIKKAREKASEIKYPDYKVGDVIQLADDIIDIDARITGAPLGYISAQVRRREIYKFLLRRNARGKIIEIRIADIYVMFKMKNPERAKKRGLDKPILLRKQMLKLCKQKI